MHWAAILLFAFSTVLMQPVEIRNFPDKTVRMVYTGNMGVVVTSENATWWFDGLHLPYKPEYQHLPDSIFQQAIEKKAPFDKLKGITFSHYHRDHYSAALTKKFIEAHPLIVVSGSRQVGDSLFTDHFISGWNKNGIIYGDESTRSRLEAYNLTHTWPARHGLVNNIMYSLLINGLRITHLGDADIKGSPYNQTAFLSADILIVPYWFITSPEGILILNSSGARKLVVTHITPGQKVKCDGKLNAEVIMFDEVGETIDL